MSFFKIIKKTYDGLCIHISGIQKSSCYFRVSGSGFSAFIKWHARFPTVSFRSLFEQKLWIYYSFST